MEDDVETTCPCCGEPCNHEDLILPEDVYPEDYGARPDSPLCEGCFDDWLASGQECYAWEMDP